MTKKCARSAWIAMLAGVTLLAPVAGAQEWPQWRGPNRDGCGAVLSRADHMARRVDRAMAGGCRVRLRNPCPCGRPDLPIHATGERRGHDGLSTRHRGT